MGTHQDDADGSDGIELSRRRVLGAASASATGLVGVTGGNVGARSPPSFFGECERGWERPPADYPVVDLRSPSPYTSGDFPTGVAEFVVYVHGWLEKFARGGRAQGHTLEQALRQNDYDAPTVAAIWNSNDPSWPTAKRRADVAGRRLARFLVDYLDDHPDTTVKAVDHSLGSRVILEALAALDGQEVLDNVSLIGGAVDPDSVCEGTRYGDAIEASADAVYSYHSENDDIVCDSYAVAEGTSGIGCTGSDCESRPKNYTDVDVTDSVEAHCDYGKPDVGCVPQIVSNF